MSDGWTPPVDPGDPGPGGQSGPAGGTPPGYGGGYGGGYGSPPGWGPPGTPGTEPAWGAGPGQQPGWGAPPGGPGGPPGGQPGWGAPPGAPPGQPGWGGPPAQPGWGGPPGGQPGWGQQNAPWGAPPASKPGVIPLRPLTLGEILDGSFTVIRHYPKVTLGLSAIVIAIVNLVQVGWMATFAFNDTVDFDIASFAAGGIVAVLVAAVANTVLAGMLTSVMGEAVLGRQTTIGETWARVRPRFWALLGAAFIGGLVPFLGLFACIVPGIFLWGAWSLVTPALVLERAGVRQALRRSWRLAVPDWWRVWGTRAIAALISGVLAGIIQYPGQMLAEFVSADETTVRIALSLVVIFVSQTIAQTITAPFDAGVLSLLYIDRRMRAEGLDVTLAQAAAAEAGRF
ncbi:MAG TPA: hypothetical protein VF519_07825 [Mycobacteriales bacterium]